MLKEKKPSRGPAVVYYNPERKQSSLCILLSHVCFNVSAFMIAYIDEGDGGHRVGKRNELKFEILISVITM